MSREEEVGSLYIELKRIERENDQKMAPIFALLDDEDERRKREGGPADLAAAKAFGVAFRAFLEHPAQIAYLSRHQEIKSRIAELTATSS